MNVRVCPAAEPLIRHIPEISDAAAGIAASKTITMQTFIFVLFTSGCVVQLHPFHRGDLPRSGIRNPVGMPFAEIVRLRNLSVT
jgi:hypothetical protein